MPKLRFTKKDLVWVPFDDDATLDSEVKELLKRIGDGDWHRWLTDKSEFTERLEEKKWRRLWIVAHGGNGISHIASTDESKKLTPQQLAEKLLENEFDGTRVEEVLLFVCFAGQPGGFAQALWGYLKKSFPLIKVSGFRGITSVGEGGTISYLRRGEYDLAKSAGGAGTDENLGGFIDEALLTTYPGARTYSHDI